MFVLSVYECVFTPSSLFADSKTMSGPTKVDASTIAIGCWKGRSNLNVMVTAIDCQELLERLSVRMEAEKGSSVQENKFNVDELQLNGASKVEESETTQLVADAWIYSNFWVCL